MASEVFRAREGVANPLNVVSNKLANTTQIGDTTIRWNSNGRSSSVKYDKYSSEEYERAGVRFVHTDIYKSDSDGNAKVYEVMQDNEANRRWVDAFYGSRSGDTEPNDTVIYDVKRKSYVNLRWKP